MSRYNLVKEEVKITPAFVEKFARMYVDQRSEIFFDCNSANLTALFDAHGFSSGNLRDIITRHSVAVDLKREVAARPEVIQDIYRSDLGELLMTYYFELRAPKADRFRIPLKNISYRELANQPGRGLDAIGYREKSDKIELLLGEAKVSTEKKNPPGVVDSSKDSIYKTQKKYKTNKALLLKRLTDYCRRLSDEDAAKIGLFIMLFESNRTDAYDLFFGCTLVRDYTCVKVSQDYGKFHSSPTDFDPYQVTFSILNFDKCIDEAVDLFYAKVQELCR